MSQFNTSQKKIAFYEIFVYGILAQILHIKTIKCVKKQTKGNMADFRRK